MSSISFALAASVAASLGASHSKPGQRWWKHVEVLADDKMEGRATGSEGYRKAADYVASEMKRIGLKPAGQSGYFQPVGFRSWRIAEDQCQVELLRDGSSEPLALGEDLTVSVRNGPPEVVEAPIAFVGYGLSVPEMKYDDLAGIDLKGKIALFFLGGPSTLPPSVRAHHQDGVERWKALRAAGAIGQMVVLDPDEIDQPWDRFKLSRFEPAMALEDPALNQTADDKLFMLVNPAHAGKLLKGSSHRFDELQKLRAEGKPLPTFNLPSSVRARLHYQAARLVSDNVIGQLTGSDPELKDEYLVLTAHLDHLGIGKPINGDAIYNGALDNASGVASLLEIAETFKENHIHLRRSLLLVMVTGEEKGLLGSKYFAAHPTVPSSAIVADINVDMFLPLVPFQIVRVFGLEESDLGDAIRATAKERGVEVQGDLQPKRSLFIRSDQYSFIRKGIPSIALEIGFAPNSPESAKEEEWLKLHYHAPSDDARQPVDLVAADDFNKTVGALVKAVANATDPPKWRSDSFFHRYARSPRQTSLPHP